MCGAAPTPEFRGLDNARGEWKLLAACHNLRKLHGHIGTAGLGKPPTGHLKPTRATLSAPASAGPTTRPQDDDPPHADTQRSGDHTTRLPSA